MPDVEFLSFIQASVTHSSKPALVLAGLNHLADIEWATPPRVIIGPHGRVLMEKMLSTAAALDWAMSEHKRSKSTPLSDYRVVRAMTTAAASAILNLKDLYDAIPIILDRHIALKRNQIRGLGTPSLASLIGDLDWRSGKLLPQTVINELRRIEESYSVVRNIRTDLTHYGGYFSPQLCDGRLLLWPVRYEHERGFVNLFTQDVENMDARLHIELKPFVVIALAKWLQFWSGIKDSCYEAAERASVKSIHGKFVLASDYVSFLHDSFMEYKIANNFEFIWPCGPECSGAAGGCQHNAGTAETYQQRV